MLVDGDTPEPSMRGLVRVARQPQDKGSDGQQVTRDGAALQVQRRTSLRCRPCVFLLSRL